MHQFSSFTCPVFNKGWLFPGRRQFERTLCRQHDAIAARSNGNDCIEHRPVCRSVDSTACSIGSKANPGPESSLACLTTFFLELLVAGPRVVQPKPAGGEYSGGTNAVDLEVVEGEGGWRASTSIVQPSLHTYGTVNTVCITTEDMHRIRIPGPLVSRGTQMGVVAAALFSGGGGVVAHSRAFGVDEPRCFFHLRNRITNLHFDRDRRLGQRDDGGRPNRSWMMTALMTSLSWSLQTRQHKAGQSDIRFLRYL